MQQESKSQYVKQEIRAFCSARSLQHPHQMSPQQPPQQPTPDEFDVSSELPYDILESSESSVSCLLHTGNYSIAFLALCVHDTHVMGGVCNYV